MLELVALLDEGGDAKNAGRRILAGQVETANRTETEVVSVKPLNIDPRVTPCCRKNAPVSDGAAPGSVDDASGRTTSSPPLSVPSEGEKLMELTMRKCSPNTA